MNKTKMYKLVSRYCKTPKMKDCAYRSCKGTSWLTFWEEKDYTLYRTEVTSVGCWMLVKRTNDLEYREDIFTFDGEAQIEEIISGDRDPGYAWKSRIYPR